MIPGTTYTSTSGYVTTTISAPDITTAGTVFTAGSTTYAHIPQTKEFGRIFEISALMANDPMAVKVSYELALNDFFKEKAEHFPNWDGLPEIKVNPGLDPLNRTIGIAWYAKVPIADVIDQEQKDEEALWNE